jgi:hypothetical protein
MRQAIHDWLTLGWLIGLGVLINVILGIVGLEILEFLGLWPKASEDGLERG